METRLQKCEWPGSVTKFFLVMADGVGIRYVAKSSASGTERRPWVAYAMPIEGGLFPFTLDMHYPQKPGRKADDKAKSEAIRSVMSHHARNAHYV